jgi:tungstate transport system substrate-binding protein
MRWTYAKESLRVRVGKVLATRMESGRSPEGGPIVFEHAYRLDRSRPALILALAVLAALAALVASACGVSANASGTGQGNVQRDQLIVATTTSLNDSGLLETLVLPAYEQRFPGVTVKVVAVGSGEAMAMGAKGDVDVLLVHSPTDEEQFMADGNGTLRLPFAYNYFVVVGPKGDPAGVAEAGDAAAAFAAIAKSGSTFVSRGDESGTNKKELKLWDAAGATPEGDWYLSTGQGMGETLRIASEKQGYTLTDLGTFLSQQDTLDLTRLSKETEDLKNIYDVILVNQNKFPSVNAASAEQLAQLLVSKAGQTEIAKYGAQDYGRPLFSPFASNLGQY